MRFVALKVTDITDNTKMPNVDTDITLRTFWKFGVLIGFFKKEGIKIWRILDWMDVSENVKQEARANDYWDIPRGCIIKCVLGKRVYLEEEE